MRARWAVVVGLVLLGMAVAVLPPLGAIPRMLAMPLHSSRWQVWFLTLNGLVLLTLLALPVAALVVWALARRRRAAGLPHAWRTSLAEVGIVYGTAPWVWLVMLPGSGAGVVPGRVSLVPLQDLLASVADGAAVQIVGNLLVFAALGFFVPLRFAALASVPRVVALAAVCSVVVETAQYVLQLDRVSSVDDVLLNAAGAGLAALASRHWWPTADARPDDVPDTARREETRHG